ncbi:MAG TPA: ABC transporter permease, partial [Longimicrobiales bacterium]|nr:ABC transporter permease [Longimicrobiales bacterium]
PALRAARADVGRVLRRDGDGRGTAGPARSRGGRILVAGQLALATPLLVAAGLLVRSFQELRAVDPGFQKDGIVLVDLALPRPAYDTPERVRAFHDGLRGRVAALPGVESATFTYDHPLETNWFTGFALEHLPPPEPGEAPSALLRIVDAGYVEALGIPLLAGRSFAPADRIDAPGVALVNETFARRFLPGEEPLGKRIREGTSAGNWPDSDPPTSFEIVGVVGNVRFAGLRAEAEPALYLPAAQFPYWNMTLVVQASAGVSELAGPIREAVWSLDGRLPVAGMESLEAAFARAVAQDRFNALLLALFAGVALILAAGGVFGVLSQSVAGRRREVGVRLALGAAPRRVRGRVVREGMGMALQGLAVGLGASLVAGRLLGSLLFGVEPLDPAVLLVTVSSLGVAALVSTWIPARRAAGLDPATVLRAE